MLDTGPVFVLNYSTSVARHHHLSHVLRFGRLACIPNHEVDQVPYR